MTIYAVPRDLHDLTPDEWKALLSIGDTGSPAARFHGLPIIVDGLPALRMYPTPDRVFENAGDCWRCPLEASKKAEVHAYKPPMDACAYDRDGYAPWSYKEKPWWDDYPNFFGRDGDFEYADIDAHLAAIEAAVRLPLVVEEVVAVEAA